MIKPELYHKTVGILYDAYFKGVLEHGNCACCAVGNIIAANCGFEIVDDRIGKKWRDVTTKFQSEGWASVFMTKSVDEVQIVRRNKYIGEAKRQIDATGYSWEELAKVEYAFEMAEFGDSSEDYMFNGLVAVLEVLKEIHQVTDEDLLQANNKRFKDHYAKRVSAA